MANYYQLSPHYRLSHKKEKVITLHHILDEETFLINDIIHTFLSFFEKKPITFNQSIKLFTKKYGGEPEDIAIKVNQFFSNMFYQSILIRAEHHAHLVSFSSQKNIQEQQFLIDFEMVKVLAKEYFLSIFLVKNKESNALSVLKILHLNAFFIPEERLDSRKSFLQEINIYKEISGHSSIVQYLHSSEQNDIMTLQLEYVNGLGLRRFILDNLTLTLDNRIKIYKNILEAFAYLHTMDVLHGDIHAGNILVKEDLSIKVIDFDMAHHNSRRRSEIISRGGVQTYIAPEKVTKNAFQVANKRADFRSEVYQLGILGYFIFIESFPFEADSWKLLAKKIKNEKPSFSENKAQIVPQKIIAFLEKSLEKVPQNRFSSAIEMNSLFLFD